MDVQILSTQTIKPSMPTPHHLRTFKPSFLDQISAPFYIPLTLFYNTKFDHTEVPQIHDQLKKSLSIILNLYYPLAGRIQDMFTIVCNDEGVLYKEAIADFTLSEFLQKPDLNILNKFLPRKTNSLENGINDFQVSIQVSILACGGLVIGTSIFHKIVDVATMTTFLKTWANFSSSSGHHRINEINHHQDLSIGSSLFPPLPSFPRDYLSNYMNFYFSDGKSYSRTRRYVFPRSAIAELRAKAASHAVPNPSRIETLTAFISDRLSAGFKSLEKHAMIISQSVNIRRRLNPPLPDNAFGNLMWFPFLSPPGETELPEHVEMMREVLDGINGESLSELDPESVVCAVESCVRTVNESDGVFRFYHFTSWCNVGFYDLDFGWGLRPVWVAHMGDADGQSRTMRNFTFVDGKNGDGEIELWVLFGDEEIDVLENDPEFTAYAVSNPSVSI